MLKKVVIIFITLGVLILITLLVKPTSNKKVPEPSYDIDSGVKAYLQALCNKDYSICDRMIATDGFSITGFDSSIQAIQSPVSSDIYYEFLNLAVDSIEHIDILEVKENIDTGYVDYKIEVFYKPYDKVYTFDVDKDYISSLLNQYIDEEISDKELSEKVQDYSLDLFKSLFVLDDDKHITSKILVLSEKKDINGVVYVYNTKTFIESFISEEMYNNLEVYQSNIKAKIDTVLRQY